LFSYGRMQSAYPVTTVCGRFRRWWMRRRKSRNGSASAFGALQSPATNPPLSRFLLEAPDKNHFPPRAQRVGIASGISLSGTMRTRSDTMRTRSDTMRTRFTLWTIWGCFLARALFYCAAVPLWEGYDEYSHFALIHYVATHNGRFPPGGISPNSSRAVGESRRLTPGAWIIHDSSQGILSYDEYFRLPSPEQNYGGLIRHNAGGGLPTARLAQFRDGGIVTLFDHLSGVGPVSSPSVVAIGAVLYISATTVLLWLAYRIALSPRVVPS
jgi:hypothetical protein